MRCPCGRPLTDPVSRARGLGPVCYRRLRGRVELRPRRIRIQTAAPHPRAVPLRRDTQLAFEIWEDDGPEVDDTPYITDVPTGALL